MQTLLYFHDPMCSWCWGYRPTWLKLLQLIPGSIHIEYIVGGLAPDSDQIMPKRMVNAIQTHWHRIESELGTQFNYDFWVECAPRRSTYPACRAVIAAKLQNAEQVMIHAIQEAYYLKAKNPSNIDTLVMLAENLKLNVEHFKRDLRSQQTEETLIEQVDLARKLDVPGFPSLVLKSKGSLYPIDVNYTDAKVTAKLIMKYLSV